MIKHYKPAELERIAEEFRSGRSFLLDGRALRVEAAIEAEGFDLFPITGLSEIADAYLPMIGRRVFIDREQYDNCLSLRCHFTLAEELAHILIHVPIFKGMSPAKIQDFQSKISDNDYLRMERDAKHLAGALLMPKGEFTERFNHFWQLQSTNVANELKILRYVIRQLSFDFCVSCHAAAIRALKLNLIDQPQFDDWVESIGWSGASA